MYWMGFDESNTYAYLIDRVFQFFTSDMQSEKAFIGCKELPSNIIVEVSSV